MITHEWGSADYGEEWSCIYVLRRLERRRRRRENDKAKKKAREAERESFMSKSLSLQSGQ